MVWSLTVGYFSDAEIQVERMYMVVLQDDNSHRLVGFYHSGSVGKIRLGAITQAVWILPFGVDIDRKRSVLLRPVGQ